MPLTRFLEKGASRLFHGRIVTTPSERGYLKRTKELFDILHIHPQVNQKAAAPSRYYVKIYIGLCLCVCLFVCSHFGSRLTSCLKKPKRSRGGEFSEENYTIFHSKSEKLYLHTTRTRCAYNSGHKTIVNWNTKYYVGKILQSFHLSLVPHSFSKENWKSSRTLKITKIRFSVGERGGTYPENVRNT